MTDQPTTPTLEEALDAFAQDLLAKARDTGDLKAMLEAFGAVGAFAKARQVAQSVASPAEPKTKSKFGRLRDEFNGHSNKAPRRGRKPAAEADSADDAAPTH